MADTPRKPAKKTAAAKPTAVQHDVTVTDTPDSYAEQGGRIDAVCTCGWKSYDRYERDRYAASVRAVVQEAADRHAADPDAPEPLS